MFFEYLLLIASITLSDYRLVVYGNVYQSDGVTPVTSIGGKGWHVSINGNRNSDDFFVAYSGNSYKVYIKDSAIRDQKRVVSVLFWDGDNADSNFEGIRILSQSKIDVCFSPKSP